MAAEIKKRHVISYEKMSPEVAEAFAEKYPLGFNDYFQDLVKYTKPDGTPFYAVTLEVPDAVYLVKIQVKTDDLDEVEKWLDEDEASDTDSSVPESESGDGTLPDDNISQYGGDEEPSDA